MTTKSLSRLLTVREAAPLLGGERYVRRLIEERRIEYVKDRHRVFLSEAVVLAYVAARTVKPRAVRRAA